MKFLGVTLVSGIFKYGDDPQKRPIIFGVIFIIQITYLVLPLKNTKSCQNINQGVEGMSTLSIKRVRVFPHTDVSIGGAACTSPPVLESAPRMKSIDPALTLRVWAWLMTALGFVRPGFSNAFQSTLLSIWYCVPGPL